MQHILETVSSVIWTLFLPVLVVMAFLIWPKTIFKIKNKITKPSKPTLKQAVGPIAISLGAMVGTGAIIGVLGAISKLPDGVSPEAIAVWSLVGVIIMIPLIYSEVIITKVLNKSPKEYISMLISPKAGTIYAFSFMILYVFGFGGFQFQGINDVVNVILNTQGTELTIMQSYFFIVIPLFLFSSAVILTKKHDLFIGALTVMIVIAVGGYIIFLVAFVIGSGHHIVEYLSQMVKELTHPANIGIGLPIGLLFGLQRIIQTAEAGLGGLAMSSLESDSKPRAAGIIAIIPSLVTILIAILGTSYVASYGLAEGLMTKDTLNLSTFLYTAHAVTGAPGVVIVIIFAVLSGLTTLIGSYYFVGLLMNYTENQEIGLYMTLIFIAGTLAVFGAGIVFEMIDLLMFLVTALNVLALYMFIKKEWKKYIIKTEK